MLLLLLLPSLRLTEARVLSEQAAAAAKAAEEERKMEESTRKKNETRLQRLRAISEEEEKAREQAQRDAEFAEQFAEAPEKKKEVTLPSFSDEKDAMLQAGTTYTCVIPVGEARLGIALSDAHNHHVQIQTAVPTGAVMRHAPETKAGDVLCAINGKSVLHTSLHDVRTMLVGAGRPLTLTLHSEDGATAPSMPPKLKSPPSMRLSRKASQARLHRAELERAQLERVEAERAKHEARIIAAEEQAQAAEARALAAEARVREIETAAGEAVASKQQSGGEIFFFPFNYCTQERERERERETKRERERERELIVATCELNSLSQSISFFYQIQISS